MIEKIDRVKKSKKNPDFILYGSGIPGIFFKIFLYSSGNIFVKDFAIK